MVIVTNVVALPLNLYAENDETTLVSMARGDVCHVNVELL